MNILVAQSAGFCWGVRQAMDAVLEASARWGNKGPVQTLGPLIHNPQALEQVALRGVTQSALAAEVGGGTVIIRAHGIPVQELRDLKARHRNKALRLVNGTCPEVTKVQARIKRYASKGYFTVLLGTHGHAEAVAHESYATSGCAVVASLQEARALKLDIDRKILVIAQTTFLVSEFAEIAAHIRSRVPDCVVLNTICKDTWMRQKEAETLCQRVDHVVVAGGKASNNTRHLVDLAREAGKSVQHIETARELDLDLVSGASSVGVLAGASTPNWLVDEVVEALEAAQQQMGLLARLIRFEERTSFLEAAGAGLLTLGIHHWMRLLPSPYVFPFLTTACLWGMGLLRAFRREGMLGPRVLRILGRYPASKDLMEAIALTGLVIALPVFLSGGSWDGKVLVAASLVFTVGLAQAGVRGILDLQKNRILGREVLVTALGKSGAKILLVILAISVTIGFAWVISRQPMHGREWLQLVIVAVTTFFSLVHLWWVHEHFRTGRARRRSGHNMSAWFAGVLALL